MLSLDTFQVYPTSVLREPLTLRWFYNSDFLDVDNVSVLGASQNFYIEFQCSISSGVVTVLTEDVFTTLDANIQSPQSVNCSAWFYIGNSKKDALFTQWVVPSEAEYPGGVITFAQLAIYNTGANTLANPPSTYLTEAETIAYFGTLSPASNASALIKGISKLSVAPVSATNPIAVGDNDPRVTQFNAGLYTAEVQTVPTPTTAPTVSTPTVTLGTFGTQPGNAAFTDAHRYQVAITYNGRTGESTIGPASSFTATEGQGLAVAPNAPSTTLAASANIYIKDLDGDNTWRRASDASGVVENNNCGFGDNNSAIGGMAVKYNVAGAAPPGVSTATKPDGSTALGETPTLAPTLTKLTAILSTIGPVFYSYSWLTQNGETALSPFSSGVTAPSGTIGAWMPLFVAEQPPAGAVAIRVYAGLSATEAAMRLQVENPLQPRHPIHSYNGSGAAHVTATPTTTICPSQLAFNAWLAVGGPGHVVLDAAENRFHPLIFGSFSGSNKYGCRFTTHGTNNESSNATTGKIKSNYTGSRADATGVLICTTSLEIDNIEFGDPNSKVKYGLVIADFLGGQGHQNKYHNITVRALESGGIGILSKTNHCNSGGHASDTNVFIGKTSVFAESWAADFSGGQTVGHQIDNLAPVITNADAIANSGVVRQATTNIDYGLILGSASGHHQIYVTNEYLDPFATSNGQFTAQMVYNDSSDLVKYIYTSPLDINGSLFEIGSTYESNGSGGQIYGVLEDNPARGTIHLFQMWGSSVYNFSNSVSGAKEHGIYPLQLTTPNWGSRTSTAYSTPMRVLCNGAYGLRNASGNLSTIATNANGDVVLTPNSGAVKLPSGRILETNIVAPSTPAAGLTEVYVDSTAKTLKAKNDAGTVSTTVIPDTGAANNFLTAISAGGVISKAQPAITDVSGLGTGVGTFLAAPSSANLAAALIDETGSGAAVFANTPTLVTPVLGAAAGTSLALGGGTALTTTNRTGTGNLVLDGSPTLTTPVIGVATGTSLAATSFLKVNATGKLSTAPKTNDVWGAAISLDVTISNHDITAIFGTSATCTITPTAAGSAGDWIFISTINGAGGSVVVTFASTFHSSGTQTTTASRFSSIAFRSTGSVWVEQYRTTDLA